jgi:KaiC/GvpD/RAD55 family RecA-like ATPase
MDSQSKNVIHVLQHISVKKQMKLLKTGIAGLDELLQGGLPPRVFLLQGPPGSGNEVFARQVAYSRAKQTGVTYFTVTRNSDFVKDDMSAYGWEVSSLENVGSWKFMRLPQSSMTDIVVQEMRQKRCVVLDSLSELPMTAKTQETLIALLNSMSSQSREYEQFHLILLTEGMQDTKIEATLQHFADGVILFTTTYGPESSSRSMMIKKMRGTVFPTRVLPYSIGEKGFTIETAIRIT